MAFVGEIVAFSDAIGNLGFINFDNMAVLKLKAHDGKINDIDVGSTGLLGSLSTSGQVRFWNTAPIVETLKEAEPHTTHDIENIDQLMEGEFDNNTRTYCLNMY